MNCIKKSKRPQIQCKAQSHRPGTQIKLGKITWQYQPNQSTRHSQPKCNNTIDMQMAFASTCTHNTRSNHQSTTTTIGTHQQPWDCTSMTTPERTPKSQSNSQIKHATCNRNPLKENHQAPKTANRQIEKPVSQPGKRRADQTTATTAYSDASLRN